VNLLPQRHAVHHLVRHQPAPQQAARRLPRRPLLLGGGDVRLELPPGGANVAFTDGSVRFLKESIDSTPIDPKGSFDFMPGTTGAHWDSTRRRVVLDPGMRLGVFQSLSTRAGGEIVSADAY
jgi:prepilin-type processing-associated H-X9-DG protein